MCDGSIPSGLGVFGKVSVNPFHLPTLPSHTFREEHDDSGIGVCNYPNL